MAACSRLALWSAPARSAEPTTGAASFVAQNAFWSALVQGRYQDLDTITEQLTGAYMAHPNNATTNLYLGMAHLWAVAERERVKPTPARIIDRLTLADFYLGQAAQFLPDDARIAGFQASARMAMGSVHRDERWERLGYLEIQDAITDYPEFNLFILSASMSQLPVGDLGLA